jgi:hypothetical protein
MKKEDRVNKIISQLEDAKTSIEEARGEVNEEQRDTLLDDAETAIENVTEELEDSDSDG